MKLSDILYDIEYFPYGSVDTEVRGITYNSKKVRKNFIFVAMHGQHVDGAKFIPEAINAGASVIVSEGYTETANATRIVVRNAKLALARLSANFYRHPDAALTMIGVTGTNGKTTITYFLESLFGKVGLKTGIVGTVNYRYGGTVITAPNTTPQSSDLYRILRGMAGQKTDIAVLEVSSHALAQGRVEGIEFDTAIFTNLTRDHLDYHITMEDYFKAKSLLFTTYLARNKKNNPKFAIINTDDPWGRRLIELIKQPTTILTYGLASGANFRAENIKMGHTGCEFLLSSPAGKKRMKLRHIGKHNIYNALAAAAAGTANGLSLDAVIYGIENAPPAPGRLQKVDEGQPFLVVVDYAHTDDALVNVLTTLRQLDPARLITVFGCGGDRDRSKRPVMGEAATRLSDFVFLTSDNPRCEDPQRIALDIEVGIRRQHRSNYKVILDREDAIAAAINMAQKGDIILLAGKGHEVYQIVSDKRLHFNDVEVARKYLRKKYK
jgi:UDP-N-acetylmuramoyl-L-alanyl-D-glutamate--2,6-diaminopimelate ligase